MLPYTKPHLSFDDQVQLLKSRGMTVDDPAAAAELLSVVGYYRLSGYWYPYRRQLGNRQRDDQFVAGTNFSTVVRLYDADRRLKLHVLDAVERVEICGTATWSTRSVRGNWPLSPNCSISAPRT